MRDSIKVVTVMALVFGAACGSSSKGPPAPRADGGRDVAAPDGGPGSDGAAPDVAAPADGRDGAPSGDGMAPDVRAGDGGAVDAPRDAAPPSADAAPSPDLSPDLAPPDLGPPPCMETALRCNPM